MSGDQTNDRGGAGAARARLDAERRRARRAAAGADRARRPTQLRARIGDPGLLAAVLRFLEAHEPDLVACADALGVAPSRLVEARAGAGSDEAGRPADQRLRRGDAPLRDPFRRLGGRGADLSFALDAAGLRRRPAQPRRPRRAGGAGLAAARHVLRARDAPAERRARARPRRCSRSAATPTSSSSPISATIIRPTASPSSRRSTSATACCATAAARAGRCWS